VYPDREILQQLGKELCRKKIIGIIFPEPFLPVPDAEDCGEAPGLSDPISYSRPDLSFRTGGNPFQKPPKDLQ
jgi:hypothetical protein